MIRTLTSSRLWILVLLLLFVPLRLSVARDQAWDQDHTDHTPIEPDNPYDDSGDEDDGDEDDDEEPEDDSEPGPDEEEEEDCSCENKGSPFLLNTGRVTATEEDIVSPGAGPLLHVKRTYNGADFSDGLLGKGWYFYFGKIVAKLRNSRGDEYLYIRWRDGQKYRLKKTGAGYSPVAGRVKPMFTVKDHASGGWQLTTKSGEVTVFNTSGHIVSITDPNGLSISVTYYPNGCAKRATNAVGNYIDFTYGASGKLETAADNFGRSTTYSYDANGNLVTVAYSDGGTLTYGYDAKSRLVSATNYRGQLLWNVTHWDDTVSGVNSLNRGKVKTFTEKGMLYNVVYYDGYLTETDTLGNRITIYYNDRGVVTQRIFPDNSSVRRQPNPAYPDAVDWIEDELGNRSTYTYDDNGNRTSYTSPTGDMWRWTYDHKDRKIKEIGPDGRTTRWEYDGSNNITKVIMAAGLPDETTVNMTYDSEGNMTSVTDPEGNVFTFSYDALGNKVGETQPTGDTTAWSYDSLGHLLSRTDAEGNTWRYEYNAAGLRIREINPLGDTAVWTYDVGGNRTSAKDFAGRVSTYEYDAFSRIVRFINPLGDTTTYDYDHMDNVVKTVGSGMRPMFKTYDRRGRMLYQIQKVSEDTLSNPNYPTYDTDDIIVGYTYDKAGNVTQLRNPMNSATYYTYDAMNRPISVRDPLSRTTTYAYTEANTDTLITHPNGNFTRKIYDGVGRLVEMQDSLGTIARVEYDDNGKRVATTVPGKGTLRISYDALGRKIAEQDSSGKKVSYTYDGNGRLASRSDGNSTTSYGYDALGRRIFEANALGDTVRFAYDKAGNRTSVTDAEGNATVFAYDALDRVTSITFPDAGVKSFTYTKTGQVATMTQPGGTVVTHTYDDAGRLVNRSYSDGTPADTFTYDKAGRMLTANNAVAQVSMTYDAGNRITQLTRVIDGTTYPVQHGYATDGSYMTTRYPNSRTLTEAFDLRHRLDSLTWGYYGGGMVAKYTYDGMNTLSRTYGNGVSANYTYAHGNLAGVNYTHTTATGLPNFNYNYSNTGLKSSKTDLTFPTRSEKYTYDAANRLAGFDRGVIDATETIASPTTSQVWNLDSRYNWESFTDNGTVETRTHNGVNEIATSTAHALTWDANGNLSTLDGTTFGWDAENRLASANGVTYGYDALGRRVKKVANATTTHYVYDDDQVIYEHDVTNNSRKWYTYGAYVDEVLTMHTDSATYYMLQDGQYSVIMATDTDGAPVESYQYDPYGKMTVFNAAGTAIATSAIGNSYTFTGRRYDSETGLYYFRARYYSPDLGRFTNRDPLGYVDGYNLYPGYFVVNAMDPQGMAKCEVFALHLPKVSIDVNAWQVKVTASLEFKESLKSCRKCCPKGTSNAGKWVTDRELSFNLQAQASVEGKSFGGALSIGGFDGDWWAGVKVTGGLAASADWTFSSDRCNNKPLSGKGCFAGEGFVAISIGAEASLKVEKGWFEISATVGINGTGKGSVTIKKCLSCPSGKESCNWEPTEVCFNAAITATASAFFISYTWELWDGKVCPLP